MTDGRLSLNSATRLCCCGQPIEVTHACITQPPPQGIVLPNGYYNPLSNPSFQPWYVTIDGQLRYAGQPPDQVGSNV